ncbi:MAG: T9SS type A sorting domain-containing protein [bacterium]
MKYILLSFYFSLQLIGNTNALGIRSGEIVTEIFPPISDLYIGANVTIYTDSSVSTQTFLHLNWGDGNIDSVEFQPQNSSICNTNIFYFEHYYSNYGDYTISINEPSYAANITNIINSSQEPFRIEKYVRLNPLIGENSSPLFTQSPPCVWQCCNWIFNSGIWDADDDSLSFEIVPCLASNYILTNATIDGQTGDLYFQPDSVGKYAIAFKVDEWRNLSTTPEIIGSTTRQLLLNVNSLIGIDENEFNNSISIYPNPVSNTLYLLSPELNINKINIFNSTGSCIYSDEIKNVNSEINVSNLSKGIYFLELITENGNIYKKVVKE